MTPPLTDRLAREISPYFPSRPSTAPHTERSLFVQVDSRERAAFDADGLANDFAGTAHFIVSETTPTGWLDSTQTTYRSKRFSYFLQDGRNLVLRELDPRQAFDPTADLAQAPPIRRPFPSRTESPTRPPTFAEAQAWALEAVRSHPLSIFVGNIDARPGNEIEFLRRGIESLGILNVGSIFGS